MQRPGYWQPETEGRGRGCGTRYIQMGTLPGLFLFKQSLLPRQPPPSRSSEIYNKSDAAATSEDSPKDSHGVVSPLLFSLSLSSFAYRIAEARGEGEGRGDRCIVRIFRNEIHLRHLESFVGKGSFVRPLDQLSRKTVNRRSSSTTVLLFSLSFLSFSSFLTDFLRSSRPVSSSDNNNTSKRNRTCSTERERRV